MAVEREVYIGDGVYVSIDIPAETLWLRAPNFRESAVALEPPVLERFIEYACRQGFQHTIEQALNTHRGGGR